MKKRFVLKRGVESFAFVPTERFYRGYRTFKRNEIVFSHRRRRDKVVKVTFRYLPEMYLRWKLFSGKKVDKTTRFAKVYGMRPVWWGNRPALLTVQEMVRGEPVRYREIRHLYEKLPVQDLEGNILKTKAGKFVIVDFMPRIIEWMDLKPLKEELPLQHSWETYFHGSRISFEELFTKESKGFGHISKNYLPDYIKRKISRGEITFATPENFIEKMDKYSEHIKRQSSLNRYMLDEQLKQYKKPLPRMVLLNSYFKALSRSEEKLSFKLLRALSKIRKII